MSFIQAYQQSSNARLGIINGLLVDFNADIGLSLSGSGVVSWENIYYGTKISAQVGLPDVRKNTAFGGKNYIYLEPGVKEFGTYFIGNSFHGGITIISVARFTPGNNSMLWSLEGPTGDPGSITDMWNNGGRLGFNGFNSECYGPPEGNLGSPFIHVVSWTNQNLASSKFYMNGVDITANKAGTIFTKPLGEYLRLGRSTPGYQINGDFARFMMYNRVLSDAEVMSISSYLNAIYRIY